MEAEETIVGDEKGAKKQSVNTAFEKWMWIDFFGFDNTRADFGVGVFLDAAGFVPNGVSLLMCNADFVHTHDGVEADRTLPSDYCAYGDFSPRSEFTYRSVHQRQQWTKRQLQGLIRALQSRGIAVYFNVFDLFRSQEWIGQHPELLHIRRNGERIQSICPWKRLANGTWYEDFFVGQLSRVVRDYGFDGFHCADGYAHQRIPISEGDFSDDLVEQFLQATGMALPDPVAGRCADDVGRMERRADWIWRESRREWIRFHGARIRRFMEKTVNALHADGKRMIMNSAWTKDPFEAMYRYGVDYRAMADQGIDAFVVEAAAGAAELDGYERIMGRRPLYPFLATTLIFRGYVPQTPLIYLNGIKDSTEGWSVLRHAPTTLEAEINFLGNLYHYDDQGKLRRCVEGPMACTADGIRAEEWALIREWWENSFDFQPQRLLGATLVWSDQAFARQLEDYIATRHWTMHRLMHHLLEMNAPVHAIVNVRHLAQVKGPILVLNPHLFPEAELRQILAYSNGPRILIGGEVPLPQSPDFQFVDVYPPEPLVCAVYGAIGKCEVTLECDEVEKVPADMKAVPEPSGPHAMFYYDLYYRKVSKSFLRACAGVIIECAGGVKVLTETEFIKVVAMEGQNGTLRLLIGNECHGYVTPHLDVGRPIKHVRVVSRFPLWNIILTGSALDVRIPGRGMVVLELELNPT